ncbi:unnamed protein product [Caenorhabditis auriculariae]|uniref:Uncharacterized protein n=1 Tax=Caenorhabditis auriculariae TaxID=2777116 RepID=A0A8S1HYG9_9PELO|nr:unnamed protein product [Caenorhabditis auriculariae]
MGFFLIEDRGTRNVALMGMTFALHFFAYMSLEFIQEPLIESVHKNGGDISEHAGYESFAITYLVFTLSCLIIAPVVNWLTPKWAIALGLVFNQIFMASFINLNKYFFLSASALLGLGASFVWVGHGAYLAQNCTPKNIERNSSILWIIFKTSLVAGGIYLYFMFRERTVDDIIKDGSITTLVGIFISISLLGTLNTVLLPRPEYKDPSEGMTLSENLAFTWKLIATKKMCLLAVLFIYAGISRSFWISVYPACIKFTSSLGGNTTKLLAFSAIATGIGQIGAGFVLSVLGRRARVIGKDMIILAAALLHFLSFIAIILIFPNDAPLHTTTGVSGFFAPSPVIALICSGTLGFGDAIIQTQIYTFLIDEYPSQSTFAFAIFKFYSAASTSAAFFYAKTFTLLWHIIVLTFTAFAAAFCAFYLQRHFKNNSNHASQDNSLETKQNEGEVAMEVKKHSIIIDGVNS